MENRLKRQKKCGKLKKLRFFRKKVPKNFVGSKKTSTFALAIKKRTSCLLILGYGVMVTLQILVLSFLVRVRVSQQSKSSILSLGYGVMVTLQILVLSFLVRVRVSQLIR